MEHNKTEVFKSYSEFAKRSDKNVNGVSEDFAKENHDWEVDNKTNVGCWNCSDCSDCSYCRSCSDCSDCSYCRSCSYCSDCRYCRSCSSCSDCSYCRYCSSCSDCSSCSYCRDCSYCSSCSDCSGKTGDVEGKTPTIEGIHSKVLEAVKTEGALEMSDWHKCDTTHCRAGWVVHLAGEKGYALEKETDTCFAAMMIYKKSTDIKVSPVRFFESNEQAMKDIERCALEERNSVVNKRQ